MKKYLCGLIFVFCFAFSSLSFSEQDVCKVNEFTALLACGELYQDQGSYYMAKEKFKGAITKSGEDKLKLSLSWAALGYNYFLSGNEVNTQKEDTSEITRICLDANKGATASANENNVLGTCQCVNKETSDDKAKCILEASLRFANSLSNPRHDVLSIIENYLGMLYMTLQRADKSKEYFKNAKDHAINSDNKYLKLSSDVNLSLLNNKPNECLNQFDVDPFPDPCDNNAFIREDNAQRDELFSVYNALMASDPDIDNYRKLKLLLNISERLAYLDTRSDENTYLKAKVIIVQAYHLASEGNYIRLRSEARGYLAKLDLLHGRTQSALQELEAAIFDAQQTNSTDLLMKFEKEYAQILISEETDNLDFILQSFARVDSRIQSIRGSLPENVYGNSRSSLKEVVDPIYRAYADLFLTAAAKASTEYELQQMLLNKALYAMEIIKKIKLEDFMMVNCNLNTNDFVSLNDLKEPILSINNDEVTKPVVVYPIILSDRMDVLFWVPGSSPIRLEKGEILSKDDLLTLTSKLSYCFRHRPNKDTGDVCVDRMVLDNQIDLYKKLKIDSIGKVANTIIFVPDDLLTGIPLVALKKDREKYLVDQYAVVTLPGLTLKKKPFPADDNPHMLIASLEQLDQHSASKIMTAYARDEYSMKYKYDVDCLYLKNNNSHCNKDSSYIKELNAVENFISNLKLKNVDSEACSLNHKMNGSTWLKNEEFTSQTFENEVKSGKYTIVHVATHGHFYKDASKSFVMTSDDKISLSKFESILSSDTLNHSPIDLLSFSACDSAGGNELALLGFSGLAIKTNALSAIGSLWSADDEFATEFMLAFYDKYKKNGFKSKAKVLQEVQKLYLKEDKANKGKRKGYINPYFWAPYILVGNW